MRFYPPPSHINKFNLKKHCEIVIRSLSLKKYHFIESPHLCGSKTVSVSKVGKVIVIYHPSARAVITCLTITSGNDIGHYSPYGVFG